MIPIKILIVEDMANIRKLYDLSLIQNVFDKQFAPDGQTALDTYALWKPDIILLDIGLPVLSGFMVLKHIREKLGDRKTTIIMQTSRSEKGDIVECAKYGIQGYITKPFAPAEVGNRILEYYGRTESQRAKEALEALEEFKKAANPVSTETTSDVEEKYLAEVLSCLAEGPISETQRKLLNHMAGKFGISAERAAALEHIINQVKVSYTPAEMEYMEELDLCMEGGTISDDARKILDRHRMKLAISEKRANELEIAVTKKKAPAPVIPMA